MYPSNELWVQDRPWPVTDDSADPEVSTYRRVQFVSYFINDLRYLLILSEAG